MPQCQVCEKDKQDGEEKKFYSGRVLKEERGAERMAYGGGREVDVTTTYGEFVEHRYFLCADCHTLWDKVVMWSGIALTIIATITLLVISARQNVDWMFVLALVVLVAGVVSVQQMSTEVRLSRRVRRERGLDDQIKVFSEVAYVVLLKQQ